MKSNTGTKNKAKTLEKMSIKNEAIYIDNKSIESLPMLYYSNNQLFHTSLGGRKTNAYTLLLE